MLTTFINCYKLFRYDRSEIFTRFTDIVINKIRRREDDEPLIYCALNRLAFINEKENFLKLYRAMNENKRFSLMEDSRFMVMALQALAIQEVYDLNVWTEILRQIVLESDDDRYRNDDRFHRSLGISLELFEIDNSKALGEHNKEFTDLFQ